jgi:hypothetical protein
MTIKKPQLVFIIILLLCASLIAVFALVKTNKGAGDTEDAAAHTQGFLLTPEGIQKTKQNGQELEHEIIVPATSISSFVAVNKNVIIYTTNADPENSRAVDIYMYNDETKANISVYDTKIEETIFADLDRVDNTHFGALEYSVKDNTSVLNLYNVETGEVEKVASPAKDNLVAQWRPSPSGKTIAFTGSVNDLYYYNTVDKTSNIIGTFDNVFGYLNETTVWASNVDDNKKMSVYNTETKSLKAASLNKDLKDKVFLNGVLLTASPQEELIWLASGEYEKGIATQRLIKTTGDTFKTLYDFTSKGYSLSEHPIIYNKDKSLVAVSVLDDSYTATILVLDTKTGKLLTGFYGQQFAFVE